MIQSLEIRFLTLALLIRQVSKCATDESQLEPGNRTIANVTLAKKMVFELGGFANLTDEFSANLTVKYGSWTEAAGNYSFTEDPDETASSLNFTDKTVGEVVGLINDLADVEAQIVDTTGEGTSYSVIITSANTGFENGFQITGADRWATTIPVAMGFRIALASCLQMPLLNWMVWPLRGKKFNYRSNRWSLN